MDEETADRTRTKARRIAVVAVVGVAMALPAFGLYQKHELTVAERGGAQTQIERSEATALAC